jgi:hypothetical protein
MVKDLKREEVRKILEELQNKTPRSEIHWVQDVKTKEVKWASVSQTATDFAGDHLLKAFEKVGDNEWTEIDLGNAIERLTDYLSKSVNVRTVLKEVLVNLDIGSFQDLLHRIEQEPKVTLGVQKGSCVYLYVRGKQGRSFPLQITK